VTLLEAQPASWQQRGVAVRLAGMATQLHCCYFKIYVVKASLCTAMAAESVAIAELCHSTEENQACKYYMKA
jgi:hypothetical protein